MTPHRLLLALLAATLVCVSFSHSMREDYSLPPLITRLRRQTHDTCSKFAIICDFVAQNCNTQVERQPWRATLLISDDTSRCTDSFRLFYQHNNTLTNCIRKLPADSKELTHALVFLELFAAWQQQNTCNAFHATEAKAATECAVNSHRPWRQKTLPLYCHDVFLMYKNKRHKLDVLCERTPYSEAFWEGYVDFIGSKTCKRYYDMMREAREEKCGTIDKILHGTKCQQMFKWYVDNKDVVETDCFEVRASKPFYRGFYLWKKQHS